MLSIVVLSVLVGCTIALPRLSNVPLLDGRIIGGSSADIEDYAYQVSLQWYGGHICGGAIISDVWVITAAHCTDGSSASTLSVRVGSSFRSSGGTVVSVSSVHQNPQYNGRNIDYDISVLQLSASLSYGSAIAPVGLPVENQNVEAGAVSVVTGWGTTSEGGSAAQRLQVVEVPIVSLADCRAAYGSNSITDRMLCAGLLGVGGKDACQGDSGGPLVINGELIGVVSWGYGCARPEYPGVYASVPALRSYISSVSEI